MNVQASLQRSGLGIANRYLAVNETFGDPFSIALSQRGHYSEVNCLLAGMVYGLMKRRRLVVDESGFEGLRWRDLYRSELPSAEPEIIRSISPEWAGLLNDDKPRFGSMRRRVHRRMRRRVPVWNFQLGLAGSVFTVARALADAFCQPSETSMAPILPEHYAAIHIRRGDKISGTFHKGEQTPPEAEDTAPEAYITAIRSKAPGVRYVWVMTDDYYAVDRLRLAAPDLTFETYCEPTERGYRQEIFSEQSVEAKLLARRRLIAETEIAIRSSLFVGCYLSNVDRFIALRHRDPTVCFSVDRQLAWIPG